jgi:hypothetical protein
MSEFGEIFAYDLTTSVYQYGSIIMMIVLAIEAFAASRHAPHRDRHFPSYSQSLRRQARL